MNFDKRIIIVTIASLLVVAMFSAAAVAQDVSARISTREAYAGMPVVLQIQVSNAQNYEMPDRISIDGCDVSAAGVPSSSSQITIINGRRSESRSVTQQYLITPRRAGTFEIPPLEIEVDGRTSTTRPIRFVATKSETGDLMFVEIVGDQDKVFVGQSLELKLKIWIKPFRDRKKRMVLDEGQMWQTLSEQTSWGKFSDRMKELADNRQRPGGGKVLRDDGQGNEREYYLYEIDATIYPTRPGKIDASDVQIVINYPTAIGKAREPFDSIFEDSPFGGSSLMKQMMDDDFFGRSPFGRRLTVTSSRPVVAEVAVDSTEVLPVPTDGRPADYRGAVGRYNIVTEAEPKAVAAGDPITLRIGIVGDGPMELVQAPPLSEISSFNSDFKVTDQSLAGFVQNDTKVFVTTVRPRRAGINEIPAIPFSFFDPEKENFETVYSKPMSITVEKAETLSLDSIVSNQRRNRLTESGDPETETAVLMPQLEINTSNDVLRSQSASSSAWWYFVLIPPVVWLAVVVAQFLPTVFGGLQQLRAAKARALARIRSATSADDIRDAMVDFIRRRMKDQADTTSQTVGALRVAGLTIKANEVESFFNKLDSRPTTVSSHTGVKPVAAMDDQMDALRNEAISIVNDLDVALAKAKRRPSSSSSSKRPRKGWGKSKRTTAGLVLALILISQNTLVADSTALKSEDSSENQILLTEAQRAEIFAEANALYIQAEQLRESDQAEANEQFAFAAEKYQLLVDQGIQNADLFVNLGNTYLQKREFGRAIANYKRALKTDPSAVTAKNNLEFAQARLASDNGGTEAAKQAPIWLSGNVSLWSGYLNEQMIGFVGRTGVQWMLAIASVCFWALLILRTFRVTIPALRMAIVPLIVMLIAGGSLYLSDSGDVPLAIVVAKEVELRSGDGSEFKVAHRIENAEGQEIEILEIRNDWFRFRDTKKREGWINQSVVDAI